MSRSVDHVFHDVIPQTAVVRIVNNDAFKIMNPFQTNLIKAIFRQEEAGKK